MFAPDAPSAPALAARAASRARAEARHRAPGHQPPAFSDALLARTARDALLDEARLTPKPALVDARSSGAHGDLDLALMIRSAHALEPTFLALARAARGARPGIALRTGLADIGRAGEAAMLRATQGRNTHRGAIWIVGLLTAGAALAGTPAANARPAAIAARICALGAHIARFDDLLGTPGDSNGARVCRRYRVGGARREARQGFPHALLAGLPALHAARTRGLGETPARVDALLAIMATLDDTCVLHRAGLPGLRAAQQGARRARALGGIATAEGRAAFDRLDRELLALNASPGGAADLLAATLFLDTLVQRHAAPRNPAWND